MKKVFSNAYAALIFLFLYLPIMVLVVFSFNGAKSRAVWDGFSLKWYVRLFQNKEILNAFSNTLVIAICSTVFATALGTIAAVGIFSLGKRSQKMTMMITNIPMLNPEIVTGVSLMLLFTIINRYMGFLSFGILTLILAHTTFCLPYVILSVMPKMRQLNPNLSEAAQDLGCKPLYAFYRIVLPEILPGVVTGALMSFTLSIDDFVITYFNNGTTATLPTMIYSMTRKIVSPEVNALSTLLFLSVLGLLIVINVRQKSSIDQQERVESEASI